MERDGEEQDGTRGAPLSAVGKIFGSDLRLRHGYKVFRKLKEWRPQIQGH